MDPLIRARREYTCVLESPCVPIRVMTCARGRVQSSLLHDSNPPLPNPSARIPPVAHRHAHGQMPPKQSKMTDAGKDDLQEKILRELYAIYNDPSSLNAALGTKGLEGLGKLAQPSSAPKQAAILTPRRRVTVMIVGNHSAGKSSFINHYTQTKCMKTSVAVSLSRAVVYLSNPLP